MPNYQVITYENIYDGINLKYYINKNGLKYDLIVNPGASVDDIRIRYEGSDGLEIDDFGNIKIKTGIEDIVDGGLLIYQDVNGLKQEIEGTFKLINNMEFGFEILEEYNSQEPLVIDPLLEYSTFLGAGSTDYGYGIAVDGAGNAVVTGYTYSSSFPTTPGAHDTQYSGITDAFVTKFNHNGSKLLYSTFLGGMIYDYGYDVEVDTAGNAFVTGTTRSTDFPTTPGAYDTFKGGWWVVFVTKLNVNGSKLLYSTFVHGSSAGSVNGDVGRSIAIDSLGNAYVCGITYSNDFDTTSGAYDPSHNGNSDGFVFKLNQTGKQLVYSTYIGGGFNDMAYGIVVDSSGNAYVTGETASTDFPTKSGAFDRTLNGSVDAFVLKLNQTGNGLFYSTFVGGNTNDHAYSIALDSKTNAVITGYTSSPDFPTIQGGNDTSFNGNFDTFVTKLNQTGSGLILSTFIGGNSIEKGTGIILDSADNIYLTGYTASPNFPVTSDAYNKTLNGYDIFLVKLPPSATSIIYSTFMGGSLTDYGEDIALDSLGSPYVVGRVSSSGFPTTQGAHDTTYAGNWDAVVFKFAFKPTIGITSLSLLKSNKPTSKIYSGLGPYTFRVNFLYSANLSDLGEVQMTLDPLGHDIKFSWKYSTGQISKLNDPNNYVILEPTSKVHNDLFRWTVDFNVTFDWLYPDENLNDVHVYATSTGLPTSWLNVSGFYQVENDLAFNGTLIVKAENNQTIPENELLRGGIRLNWTGLTTVYENTTDVYPPDDEFNVSIKDESGGEWLDSPTPGEPFFIEMSTPTISAPNGNIYTLALTVIPSECDATNQTYTLRIDADNVTFIDPMPDNSTWQTKSDVLVNINITDFGGGVVNGKSVLRSISMNNGTTWSDWENIPGLESATSIIVQDVISFTDGTDNFIKWCALDSVDNGPTESDPFRILVDTEGVEFSNAWPSPNDVSPNEQVDVGITISDTTSDVNASTIQYAVSKDKGKKWSAWNSVEGLNNSLKVVVHINYTFTNGTDNIIKWRATDVAGNDPVESPWYVISVNTWNPANKPKVVLLSPPQGFTVNETSVMFKWELEDPTMTGITYDIYFDTVTPPELYKTDITETSFFKDGLTDGATYYWRVIPRLGVLEGLCSSGVWWFQVYLDYTGPGTNFKISITGPMSISIYPGENKSIPLTITNLGTNKDMIKLERQAGQLSDHIDFEDYSILELESTGYATRTLNIDLPLDAQPGNFEIIVTAISLNSGEKEKANHFITVEIKQPGVVIPNGTGQPNGSLSNVTEQKLGENANELLVFSVIGIIIMIVIITVLTAFVLRRKKRAEQELLPSGAVTVKPLPTHIIDGQMPPAIARTQLPGVVTGGGAQQPTAVIAPAQPMPLPQVQPVPQLPQLPPAPTPTTSSISSVQPQPSIISQTPVVQPQPPYTETQVQGPTVHLPGSNAVAPAPAPTTSTPPMTMTMAELEAQRMRSMQQPAGSIVEPTGQTSPTNPTAQAAPLTQSHSPVTQPTNSQPPGPGTQEQGQAVHLPDGSEQTDGATTPNKQKFLKTQ